MSRLHRLHGELPWLPTPWCGLVASLALNRFCFRKGNRNMAESRLITSGQRCPAERMRSAYLVFTGIRESCFLLIAVVAQVLFVQWRTWLPGAEG